MDDRKNETNEQTLLGRLLQKERSDEAMAVVEAILKEPIATAEKIERIRKLDVSAADRPVRTASGISARREPTAQFDPAGISPPLFREIRRNRRRIRRHLTTPGFFARLFSHARRIQAFGRESHVLTRRLLSPNSRLDPRIGRFLEEGLQKGLVPSLLPAFDEIIQQGWITLGKREYNLVVLAAELCEALKKLDASGKPGCDRGFIERFAGVENRFLSLASRDDYPDMLRRGLRECAESLPRFAERHPQAEKMLNRLLLPDLMLPSLWNLVRGVNMLRFQRFLDLSELIDPAAGEVVSGEDFDAPPKVYLEIRRFQWEREQELIPLVEFYREVQSTSIYLRSGDSGGEDLPGEIYDAVYGEGRFLRHQGNMGHLAAAWADLLLNEFRPLLDGRIELDGLRPALFDGDFFASEFARLDLARRALEGPTEVMPTFPRDRYLRLKQSRKGAIPNEATVIEQCDEIVSAAVGIGRKLKEVMSRRLPLEIEHPDFPPLEPLHVRKGNFFLPHEHRHIEAAGIFAGLTVAEALDRVIRICFQLAVFMRDHEMATLSTREKRLERKIADLAGVLYRIASRQEFQRIREQYDLGRFLHN